MPTLATSPAYPAPGRQARLTFELTASDANYLRVWCTEAPEGSEVRSRIDSARLSRVLVYEGDGGGEAPLRLAFDKGGKYTLTCQEYVKGFGWGGGYEGDPRGAPTEVKSGTETNVALYVAQRLTQELGAGPDRATLVLYVANSTVVRTIAAVHGEASPAVINPTSDRATVAATTAAVTAAVEDLAGDAVTTVLGNIGSNVDNFIMNFASHALSLTFHNEADSQADLDDNYSGADSLAGIAKALNKLRTRFAQHILNSKENDSAHPEYQLPGGLEIHDETTKFDLVNTLLSITADENNPASIYAAAGDFFRAYEGHRVSTVHDASDSANDLAAVTGLLLVHRLFMGSLADTTPTAQPGQSTGAATLIGSAGFTET